MIVCLPTTPEGTIDPRWGRADRVAIAETAASAIESWHEVEVGWSTLHDTGTEAAHHARVVRFLREHHVEAVIADHMGPPMQDMLCRMGLAVWLGAAGDAREAVMAAVGAGPAPESGGTSGTIQAGG